MSNQKKNTTTRVGEIVDSTFTGVECADKKYGPSRSKKYNKGGLEDRQHYTYVVREIATGHVVYAGFSVDPDRRWAHHLRAYRTTPKKINEFLRANGGDAAYEMVIVSEHPTRIEANIAEHELIALLKSTGQAELNVCTGKSRTNKWRIKQLQKKATSTAAPPDRQ